MAVFWGNKSTIHYDDDGKKTGESREERTFLGDQRTIHYDSKGTKVGESREEKTFLGDERTIHYDSKGTKVGESREEKTFLGDERTIHYEKSGKKIGQSQNEKTFLGDRYTKHDGKVPYLKSRTVEPTHKLNERANDTSCGDSSVSHDGVYCGTEKESTTTLSTPDGDNTRLGCAALLVLLFLAGGFILLKPDVPSEALVRLQTAFTPPKTETSNASTWVQPGVTEANQLEIAQSEIDSVYKAVMNSLSPTQQEQLRQEEREWIQWRDGEADKIARSTSEGGSAYHVDRLNAMIRLVKQRTEYLRSYRPNKVAPSVGLQTTGINKTGPLGQAHQPISEKQQDFLPPRPQHEASSPIRVRALGMKKALSLEEAHAEIGRVYESAMRSLTPAQQTALRDEQREWIKWRDAQAERVARTFRTGPDSYSVDHEKAMISLVSERIRYLEDYRPRQTKK